MNDLILYIATFLITIVPLLREVLNRGRSQSRNYKPTLYIAFLLIISVVLIWSGITKINSDNHFRNTSDSITTALSNQVTNLNLSIAKDRKLNNEFQKRLEVNFKIVRDSVSNQPVKINTFNTYFNNAENVNIGR